MFERFPGTLVTGAQINADGTGRMDFDLSAVDNDVLRGLDADVNDVIRRAVEVRSVYVDAAEPSPPPAWCAACRWRRRRRPTARCG